MSDENKWDELDEILSDGGDIEMSSREKRQERIKKKIRKKQGQSDYIEFGFVKLWTILIEFLSVFYVRSKERQNISIK